MPVVLRPPHSVRVSWLPRRVETSHTSYPHLWVNMSRLLLSTEGGAEPDRFTNKHIPSLAGRVKRNESSRSPPERPGGSRMDDPETAVLGGSRRVVLAG